MSQRFTYAWVFGVSVCLFAKLFLVVQECLCMGNLATRAKGNLRQRCKISGSTVPRAPVSKPAASGRLGGACKRREAVRPQGREAAARRWEGAGRGDAGTLGCQGQGPGGVGAQGAGAQGRRGAGAQGVEALPRATNEDGPWAIEPDLRKDAPSGFPC